MQFPSPTAKPHIFVVCKEKKIMNFIELTAQRACHGQTTSKQRCINVCNVYTTLFQRRLTMMCPLGVPHEDNIDAAQLRKYESYEGLVKDCENYEWQIVSYGGRL